MKLRSCLLQTSWLSPRLPTLVLLASPPVLSERPGVVYREGVGMSATLSAHIFILVSLSTWRLGGQSETGQGGNAGGWGGEGRGEKEVGD